MQTRNHLAVNMLLTLGFPPSNIRKALHKLTGITQPALAQRLGVSRPTVSATIDGSRHSPDVQSGIADAFGVPVDALFQAEGQPSNA